MENQIPAAGTPAQTSPAGSSINTPFSPYSSPMIDKSYSQPQNTFSPQELQGDIPEPTYTPPPSGEQEAPQKEQTAQQQKKEKEKKQQQQQQSAFNPEMNDLPETERKVAAKQMAENLVRGYVMLNAQAGQLLKVPQRKINKEVAAGKIDLSVHVPIDLDQTISLGNFFKMIDEKCDGMFQVSEDFKEAILPPLTRELAKRGHGMTDMQTIVALVVMDAVPKLQEAMKVRATISDMMSFAREQTNVSRRPSGPPPPPQEQRVSQPVTPPPAAPTDNTPPQTEPRTLQEKALAQVIPTTSNPSGLPQYGNPSRLKNLDKVDKQMQRAGDKAKQNARSVLKSAEMKNAQPSSTMPTGSTTSVAPPTGEPKKRGRKKGSKNKPKNQ